MQLNPIIVLAWFIYGVLVPLCTGVTLFTHVFGVEIGPGDVPFHIWPGLFFVGINGYFAWKLDDPRWLILLITAELCFIIGALFFLDPTRHRPVRDPNENSIDDLRRVAREKVQ